MGSGYVEFPAGPVIVGLLVLIVIIGALWCIAIIPAGNVGISDTFGVVSSDLISPGFYFKGPFTVYVPMSIQTQIYNADATAASSDLQDVSTKVALNYRLDGTKAVNVYKTIGRGYADIVIVPAVQESVKASTATFTAEELITKRPEVKEKIDNALKDRLAQFGVIVDTISITDFKFSPEFTAAIESKVKAAQGALEAENKLRQIKVEAEQQVAAANGNAQSIKINADAQAYQLDVISQKLNQNPQLIQYKQIEKWNGIMPLVTGGATPFVSLGTLVSTVDSNTGN